MNPMVSIIIPVFNRANLIAETLDSIIVQSYGDWECILVDDGSTDNSIEVLEKYCNKDTRIKFYKRPNNRPKGANACRNYGFDLSKGKYINWFDSDDIMHPKKLEMQIKALEQSNKPFCVCQSYVFDGSLNTICGLKSEYIKTDLSFSDFLKKQIIIPVQAPVFKKQFLLEHDFAFDESLQAGQEWELFARILFVSEDYIAINKPLDYIRRHSNSISGLDVSNDQLWWYYLARYKIYKQLKTKLTKEDENYLKHYFLLIFKSLLRQKANKKALQVWKMTLITDESIRFTQQLLLIISFFSFAIFNKGDVFLTKVSRRDI